MSITTSVFGQVAGRQVKLYTLTNKAGASVSISEYGAAVQSIKVPDRNGRIQDVALGFDSTDGYLNVDEYIGVVVGRNCNRIASGRCVLDGRELSFELNDQGLNNLHTGHVGFHRKIWDITPMDSEENPSLECSVIGLDGEGGYPGNIRLTVTFTWQEDNTLVVHYDAKTDKPTICNPTCHMYWNLSGDFSSSVMNHYVKINAPKYLPLDYSKGVPTGEQAEVSGTEFDFRDFKQIGRDTASFGSNCNGAYDHNWILDADRGQDIPAAEAYDEISGRKLEVFTDQPGMQMYIGNHFDGSFGAKGFIFPQYGGFAFETQHFPDAPNHPEFPSTRLDPCQRYDSTTVYKFTTI